MYIVDLDYGQVVSSLCSYKQCFDNSIVNTQSLLKCFGVGRGGEGSGETVVTFLLR